MTNIERVIDSLTYTDMLKIWESAACDHLLLQGDARIYFIEEMGRKSHITTRDSPKPTFN